MNLNIVENNQVPQTLKGYFNVPDGISQGQDYTTYSQFRRAGVQMSHIFEIQTMSAIQS